MLVDSRRGMQDIDLELLEIIETALGDSKKQRRWNNENRVEFSVVLTKADHLEQVELVKQIETSISQLWGVENVFPTIFAASAASGYGIQSLRNHLIKQGTSRGSSSSELHR